MKCPKCGCEDVERSCSATNQAAVVGGASGAVATGTAAKGALIGSIAGPIGAAVGAVAGLITGILTVGAAALPSALSSTGLEANISARHVGIRSRRETRRWPCQQMSCLTSIVS